MKKLLFSGVFVLITAGLILSFSTATAKNNQKNCKPNMLQQGLQTFRYDTFGDEAFWGDTLQLHKAIEGAANGGEGPGISPKTALDLGLKVDVQALPQSVIQSLKNNQIDLDDPAVTLMLLKANAVVGVTGFFNDSGTLKSVGIQCALCHSTVDNSLTYGIGKRLDGIANRDLNVGAIIAASPNLQPFVDLLSVVSPSITTGDVKAVLNSWGPGKFDAEMILDGKTKNPETDNSSATLLPNAIGMGGYNLHTWTGGWGTVTYWNAFVANLEMGGIGNFFDARLDNATQFPIAAAKALGHKQTDPDSDLITSKLPALAVFQTAIPAPKPTPGLHFNEAAADRGDQIFNGKAKCGTCHIEPLWTEPGWNAHKPDEMKIDSFQADRSPDRSYKTMNLAGIFIRELGLYMKKENQGRFYHDGRFKTLMDVVNSYDIRFSLGLTEQEKIDLIEYLKSL